MVGRVFFLTIRDTLCRFGNSYRIVPLCRLGNSNRIFRAFCFVIGVVLGRFGIQICCGQIRDCSTSVRVEDNLRFTTTSRATRSRVVLHGGRGQDKVM